METSMAGEAPLASISLAEACRQCREQTARYRRGEDHDDRFCWELFRRAVVARDEACWEELHAIYGSQVLAWCRRAAGGSGDADELAAVTWQKFWRNFSAEKLNASHGSAGVLNYLKMCARSAAIDSIRASSPAQSLDERAVELPSKSPLPDEAYERQASMTEFWQVIEGTLHNQRERILIHLTYELGLKPSEIQAQRPDLFPSIRDVYQGTRNIIDRLRRNPALRAWFDQGENG